MKLKVKLGDKVSKGSVLLALGVDPCPRQLLHLHLEQRPSMGEVRGDGVGGFSAAFRAADLGRKVVQVERYATLGARA